jgi:outer membrane protein TolC
MQLLVRFIVSWLILAAPVIVQAEPLPDPLTLEYALSLAQGTHPVLDNAAADVAGAEAMVAQANASDGLRISLEGRLEHIEPAELSNFQQHNNSQLALNVRKRLYDFGHTAAARQAATQALTGSQWQYLHSSQQQYVRVMETYLDVILADMEYARDNEAMATAYVRMDKASERYELGQLSEIDLLEKQSLYQKIRQQQTTSAARQRISRSRLAIALNRPEELPANLVPPVKPVMELPNTDVGLLTTEVLEHNPLLKALRAEMASAQQSLRHASTRYGPVIHGELEAREYYRETRSTNPFSVAVVLEVPLYTGGLADADVAQATADLNKKQAVVAESELILRQAVLDLWMELETLRSRMQELEVLGDYREYYLDRSRTLYDLEVTTDLGDSMVQTSAVRLKKSHAAFQWMLVMAKLDALTGKLLPEPGEKQ